jgi:HlyD family secretion protein
MLLALGAACGRSGEKPLRVFGTIEARTVRVAPRVNGRVREVLVEEGQQVRVGQALITLNLEELSAERDRLAAAVEAAAARARLFEQGSRSETIRSLRSELASARIRERAARREVKRLQCLVAGRAAPGKQLDDARDALELARSDVKRARAQLDQAVRGFRPQEIKSAEAQLGEAKAALAEIEERLQDQQLRSPVDGVVLYRLAEPDEVAVPGASMLVLAELSRPYLDVYVPEPRVAEVAPGQHLSVEVDAYPGQYFEGIVRHVAGEAEFTPKNVQTDDQRARLVFRTRIDLKPEADWPLLLGMPAFAILPDAADGRGAR